MKKNLEYTGQTEGHLPLGNGQVLDVHPGLVLTPESEAHGKALLKTGHFAETGKRATRTPEPTPDPAQPAADQES